MKTSSLFPLLTIASIARGLPFESIDSPLTPRQTGDNGQWVDPAAPIPSPAVAVTPSENTGQWVDPAASPAVASAAPSAAASAAPSAPLSSPPVDPNENTSGGSTGGLTSPGSGPTGSGQYVLYSGPVPGGKWPGQDKWVPDFETMFNNNKDLMKGSCAQWKQPLNSEKEIQDIHSGIIAQSQSSGVDKRVILAIILQESKGCVRVISTNNGVHNPGLMQSHSGISCTETPCPTSKIHQMIEDGTSGTTMPDGTHGDGMKDTIKTATAQGGAGAEAVYLGARIYNTGSHDKGVDLNTPKLATKCYSTDVANWLTGWNGQNTGCHLDG